jgi:translocation and assembly module TamB
VSTTLLKILRITGWIVLSIFSLLILLILLIRLPAVQQQIVKEIESELQKTLHTHLSLGRVFISFSKKIEVERLYVEDQKADTLLYVENLVIDTDLWDLTQNKITLKTIGIDGLVANANKNENGIFNFDFIIESFTSDSPKASDRSIWEFSIGDVALSKINANYIDDSLKSSTKVRWDLLIIDTKTIDFANQNYDFREITLDGAKVMYTKQEESRTASNPAPDTLEHNLSPIHLNIAEIRVNQSSIEVNAGALKLDAFIGLLKLQSNNFNLNTLAANLNLLQLEESRINIVLQQSNDSIPESTNTFQPEIVLKELILKNNNITYNTTSIEKTSSAFDINHIVMNKLSVNANEIEVGKDFKANVNQLNFRLDDDFYLHNLAGAIYVGKTEMALGKIKIQTDKSELAFEAQLTYQSISKLINEQTELELDVEPSVINKEDIAYFVPAFDSLNFNVKSLNLSGAANGTFKNLKLNKLTLKTGQHTSLLANGTLENLLTPDKLGFKDANVIVKSSKAELKYLLPDSLIPSTIQLPELFEIKAVANGTINNIKGNLKLSSSYGQAIVNGTYRNQNKVPYYEMKVNSESIDVGRLIRQDSNFNNIRLAINAKGSGDQLANMAVNINGHIENVVYNNYPLEKINITGGIVDQIAFAQLGIEDPNLVIDFDGSVDMNHTYHYKANIDLKKAILDSLQLAKTPLKVKGLVSADFVTDDFKGINGKIKLNKFSADNTVGVYSIDSLLITSIHEGDNTELSIDSEIITGTVQGNIDLTTLPSVIIQHIDQYYHFTTVEESTEEARFNFEFNIKNTDIITEIVLPQLSEFKPGALKGKFDSKKNQLLIDLNIIRANYAGLLMDSVNLSAISDKQELKTTLKVAKISNENAAIHHLEATALFSDNKLSGRFSARDSVYQIRYLLNTDFESLEDGYAIRIKPDSLLLNYELWSIPVENKIVIADGRVETYNFILSNDPQLISFSKKPEDGSLLKIVFREFDLQTITSFMDKDKTLISGMLNGTVDLSLPPNDFYFNTDLRITDFHTMEKRWGDLAVKITNKNNKLYSGIVTINDAVNEATLTGTYEISSGVIDADIDVPNFNLVTVSPLLKSSIENLTGSVSCKIRYKGKFTQPQINGTITANEAHFNPVFLKNGLTIKNETISINNSVFNFRNFTIADSKDNTATLNGSLKMADFTFYTFDLSLQTKNFLVLNTERKDNTLFYGQLRADVQAQIKGNSVRPDIDMDLAINEGSEITYEVPETEYKLLDHDNIVKFVNPNQDEKAKQPQQLSDSLYFKGVTLNANIDINDKASLTIIIDPITQDKLFVKGNAALTLAINEKGDINLAGKYDLSEGIYDFSFYKLLKREFVIKKGSSIIWTGDMLDARLEVKASNLVEAAPIDLVINQLANASQEELNRYRQRLPFLVNLQIDGKLLNPEISFEIDMPENKQNAFNGNIYARVKELNARESDLNKQVFALLILNRFIADNPLQSQSGYSLEDNSRRSVSRILSDQLNRLTNNIKSVNLNFNLESYKDLSSGTGSAQTTTQLELGVSKSLFNNRLEARVEGNVNIEGQQQQNFSDYVGDLILEYKLTPDGRWRVTGFRRSDFDIISGEVIDTGAGIIYIRDYNTFKELFK